MLVNSYCPSLLLSFPHSLIILPVCLMCAELIALRACRFCSSALKVLLRTERDNK